MTQHLIWSTKIRGRLYEAATRTVSNANGYKLDGSRFKPEEVADRLIFVTTYRTDLVPTCANRGHSPPKQSPNLRKWKTRVYGDIPPHSLYAFILCSLGTGMSFQHRVLWKKHLLHNEIGNCPVILYQVKDRLKTQQVNCLLHGFQHPKHNEVMFQFLLVHQIFHAFPQLET